ncbi:quinone-dependent dihydroorotate dehydrogenase [Pseudolabrys sp. FHR47]|uniref:quinone-dependent dihydroorotate dehydrogenase n=1 Tax=Pseudolabrys sp. FHR47 TaxID=2562284 RepID=UPI0010BED104|nr:quinone-dependent dihydroorotate dehydrogenase [Pseudolabrys sp. FHR47]
MAMYRRAIRPVLFALDAEASHRATIGLCRTAGSSVILRRAAKARFGIRDSKLHTTVAGIDFPGPVGLAAGFDKNAEAAPAMSELGFGSIEVGSVSLHSSKGNSDRPRVWRLPLDEGLRIYYGCPSDGAEVVAARLKSIKLDVPLGVSLVETNTGTVTSADHAAEELAHAMTYFSGLADYLVLNLSCPNMPRGGGLFDSPEKLGMLLRCCAQPAGMPPVFLKLTPPGDAEDPSVIDLILGAVAPFDFVKGFILNIPNRDPGGTLKTPPDSLNQMRGGITGPSLRQPTNKAISAWYSRIDRKRHVLIGCGGISSADDAYRTIRLGASLVQLYTALVYQGPGLIKSINEGLSRMLERDGFRTIGEAVGVGE